MWRECFGANPYCLAFTGFLKGFTGLHSLLVPVSGAVGKTPGVRFYKTCF